MRTIFAASVIAALAYAEQSADCKAFADALVIFSNKKNGVWDQDKLVWTDNSTATPTQTTGAQLIALANKAGDNTLPAYPQALVDEKCLESIEDFPVAEVEKADIKSTEKNSNNVYNASEDTVIDLVYVSRKKGDGDANPAWKSEEGADNGDTKQFINIAEEDETKTHGKVMMQTGWRQADAGADVSLDYTLFVKFSAQENSDFAKATKPVLTMAMYADQETDNIAAEVSAFDLNCVKAVGFCDYFYGDLDASAGLTNDNLAKSFTDWQYYTTKSTFASSQYQFLFRQPTDFLRTNTGANVPQDKWKISYYTKLDVAKNDLELYMNKSLPGNTGIAKGKTTNAMVKYERAAIVTKPAANAAPVAVTPIDAPVVKQITLSWNESPEQIKAREEAEAKAAEEAKEKAKAELIEEGNVVDGESKDSSFYMTVGAASMAAIAALAF